MSENNNSAILIINNDLTSSIIFTPLILSKKIQVKLVVFDGKLTAANKNIISGAWFLFRKISKRYWVYQSFLMVCYRLASLMPAFPVLSGMQPTLRQVCRMHSIPYLVCRDVNDERFVEQIRKLSPDKLLIRCSQFLKKPLLDSVNGAVYCLHSSLLPSYKGIAAEYHSMVNSEYYIGTSLFHVVEKLDAGDVLFQKPLPITKGNSHYWHVMQNNIMASNMVIDFMTNDYNKNTNLLNSNIAESYFSWPLSNDMSTFRRNGWYLISIREIINVIRSIFYGNGRNK